MSKKLLKDTFPADLDYTREKMAELKKLHKERNELTKKGITDGQNEFYFERTLGEVEDLLSALKSLVDSYNKYKSSDHPSWPYQAKPTAPELDKRRADYDILLRDLHGIKA